MKVGVGEGVALSVAMVCATWLAVCGKLSEFVWLGILIWLVWLRD